MLVSCVYPVAILRTVFCIICSLSMLVLDALGDHMQGLPNLIGRWLASGLPRISTWLPNNNWW